MINEDKSVNLGQSDTLVIDIANEEATIEPRNLKYFLTSITDLLLRWDKSETDIAIILITNRVYGLEDFPNEKFFEFVKSKRIILIDYKGNSSFLDKYLNVDGELPLFEDYRIKIKQVFNKHHKLIFGDFLEKFKRKFIGYVGHFAREVQSDIDRCHFFFYDGIYCEKELKELLVSKIKEELPKFIIVDCPESPWLFPPVYRAVSDFANKMEIKIFNYSEDLEIIQDEDPAKKNDERDKVKNILPESKGLLLFDLIHRGNRVKKVAEDLRNLNPNLQLKTHTIVRAVNEIDFEKPNHIFEIQGREITAFHQVRQIDLRHTICPYCNKYDIPHNSKEDLNSIELSPPNFWLLCKEAKFIPEKDPPLNYRSPLRVVPDFQKMLKENGAFLSLKVKQALLKNLRLSEEQLSHITLIGPNEEGTNEISMCLSYFMDVELILIDKKAVKEAKEKNYDKSKILSTFSNEWWCSSINDRIGTGKPKEVIIFDDFSISKNTLEDYSEFIRKLGFTVTAFFPIFRFNEILEMNGIPIYSLYNFELNSAHYHFNNAS